MQPLDPVGTARWTRLEHLFAEASEMEADARVGFVHRSCDDDALRTELLRLLAAHDRAETFLDVLDARRAAALIDAVEADRAVGERIGPYHILGEIGHGGMGVVLLAERADGQFEQRVALKLVHRGVVSTATRQRFHRERQILARLQHPHIARLLGGGLTQDGRPYFTMEVVDGLPITTYAEAHSLDAEARVRLCLDAIEAVQYAHQNLVVHRDLKPSNLLVTADEQVKVLDFGIAHLLDEQGLDPDGASGSGARTPGYAAPEVIHAEAVTTAADVYALGVLLHELLTGRRPETGGPPIGGDLGAVVRKALAPDPAQRYASAGGLGDDLRRALAHRPVHARPATVGYRVASFARRHRVGVLTTTLALLSLVGGLGAAIWQGRRAAAERDLARLAEARADEVSGFLTDLLYLGDPTHALGEPVTVADAVDSAVVWMNRDLTGQPEARSDIAFKLSEVAEARGRYDVALALADTAVALARAVHGDGSVEAGWALVRRASALRSQGRLAEAEPSLREALASHRRHLGDSHINVGFTLSMLALALREQGRLDEAESAAREALAIDRSQTDGSPRRLSISLTTVGHILRARGRPAEAEPFHREALALRQALWGEVHPEVANSLVNLGQVVGEKGRAPEAVRLIREGIAVRRATQGDDHPEVGVDLGGLAALLAASGDADGARTTYREALAHQQAVLGPDHPTTQETARALATLGPPPSLRND